MRFVFLALLLANLILFVHGQGYLGGQDAGREPARLKRQLDPEKLRIVSDDLPQALPLAASAAPVPSDCKRIDGVTSAIVDEIRHGVADTPGWELSVTPIKQTPAHWVVIPELPTRGAAAKKQMELRQMGVGEGQIVEDAALGPFAVSLGVFRNPEGAAELLQSMVRKGVRSARLAKRELPPEKFSVEFHAPSEELGKKLPAWLSMAPNASLANCGSE